MKFVLRWLINTVGLLIVAYLIPGVNFESYLTAIIAALVLGIINAILRPILLILTLPINILTLGLFTLIINGFLFWLASSIVPGFMIENFAIAFWAALAYSLITWFTSAIFNSDAE